VFKHAPREIILGEVLLSHYAGQETRFSYKVAGHCDIETREIFKDKDECQVACDERNLKLDAEQERQAMAVLESSRHTLAFSVSYWRSERAKMKKDLERIEERLNESKLRKKGGSDES